MSYRRQNLVNFYRVCKSFQNITMQVYTIMLINSLRLTSPVLLPLLPIDSLTPLSLSVMIVPKISGNVSPLLINICSSCSLSHHST